MTAALALYLTEQVYDLITTATEEARAEARESGGSLLVHQDPGGLLLAYALPPGPAAQRGPASLRTDAAYQNQALAQLRQRVPELRYGGDWHIHPMWLPTLSATDRDTARAILKSEWPAEQPLCLLLGTARPGHGPVLLCFQARLRADELQVQEVTPRLVRGDDPEVLRRLGAALPDLDEVLAAPPPAPVTHVAAQRIRADLQRLREALQASGDLWASDAGLHARLRRGPCHALVVFPPDYPSGAPRVFAGTPAGHLEPIALPYGWSSAHDLIDPVAVALTPPLQRLRTAALAAARLGLHWLRRSLIITAEERA